MSIDDRRKPPALDLGTDDELDEALSGLGPDRPSIAESDSDEGDALLALLLDESEIPEEVAPRESAHGIDHAPALDFEAAAEIEVEVEESPLEEAEPASLEPFEVPLAPKLLVPEVRHFSADEDTLIYAARRSALPQEPSLPAAPSTEVTEAEEDAEADLAIEAESEPASELAADPAPAITPAPSWPDERPAPQHLEAPGRREAVLARASFVESEARRAKDPAVRARGLLVAAELLALTGDEKRARELSEAAKEAGPSHPLAHQAARAFAMREGDLGDVLAALDAEARIAKGSAARAHFSLLAAEIARIGLADLEGYEKRLEQALRASPSETRAVIAQLAGALANEQPIPRLSWPEALDAAAHNLARYRRSADEPTPAEPTPIDLLLGARHAFENRDREAAALALLGLSKVEGLGEAAAWLGAAVAAPSAKMRRRAVELLRICENGSNPALAHRWLMARALELGDAELANDILSKASPSTWKPSERLALAALTGQGLAAVEPTLAEALGNPELWPLAAGIANAIATPDVPARAEWTTGAPETQARLRLARMLAAQAPTEDRREALKTLEAAGPSPLGQALLAELELADGRLDAVAENLRALFEAEPSTDRDRSLVAGLLHELSGAGERAHADYEHARRADPSFEAAMRAALDTGNAAEAEARLLEGESSLDDPTRSAFLLLEAALRAPEDAASLLERAHEKAPALPFAAWLSERAARAHRDLEAQLSWLAKERDLADDPIRRAHLLVREARLFAKEDPARAASLLEEASRAREADLALRELYERTAQEPPADRARYWAERAEASSGEERARLALFAALDFESQGDLEEAARLARMAMEAGDEQFAPLCLGRTEGMGPSAALLTESLLEEARSSTDPIARRDAYERLAQLDERGEKGAASIALWHRAILEEHPGWLPSLRKLEQQLIDEGREDELEPIFTEIAKALDDPEATSHAVVAARLRSRTAPLAPIRDLVRAAGRVEPPSLWALRRLEASSRASGDDREAMKAAEQLAERTTRPLEKATLLLRAAEAAVRLREDEKARDRLVEALEHEPSHPIALELLATIAERLGESERAATSYEKLAETSRVDAHRLDALSRAAVLFLDHLDDRERGRAALEAAAAIDPGHPGILDRLRALYLAAGDDAALASLLARRLERATEPKERLRLEIERAGLLAQSGELAAAKEALVAALETSPDHLDALRALADLSARDEDWEGVVQALTRLAELATESEEQATLYMRLGDVHREHLGELSRAELAYAEVVARRPGDIPARERLIEVFGRSGQGAKALELQQWLLDAAAASDDKKRRTLELAMVQEQLLADPRKAEATLEALRKQLPADIDVLAALAKLLQRTGRETAAQMLLDRTANDARRALSTGRFEPSLFALLAAVASLRERHDGARIAEATLHALEGQPLEVAGVGLEAAGAQFDDLLAPDLLTPAFRTLLKRTGEVLDAAVPFDLHAIQAVPLLPEHAAIAQEIRQLATGFGIGVEVFCSPALGHVCVPASSFPPQLVLGMPLVTSAEDGVRRFLVLRALKVLSLRAAGFARTAPVDLFPLTVAYLQAFAPDWQPHGADSPQIAAFAQRIAAAMPKRLEDDTAALALEVIGVLGNRASTLHAVANGFGNRVALLAIGDPMAALKGIAWAGGNPNGPPPSGRDRITWIGRNAEARDLVVFSVSDAYAQARERLGAD